MIVMQTGAVAFTPEVGAQGRFTDVKVHFPGAVRSATAVLCGWYAQYGSTPAPLEDHHVAGVGAGVEIIEVVGSSVTVDCVLNLRDDNGDDLMSGSIAFCVIADVLELPTPDLPDVATGVLTES
jgi:hypothetical protein